MSYECLALLVGFVIIFSGTIVSSIQRLRHKKRAKVAATTFAPDK